MRMVIEQRQMLKMVMTTELRQAIELLQLPTYELMKFIQKEAEENPLIELLENNNFNNHYQKSGQIRSDDQEVDPLNFIKDNDATLYDYLLEQVNVLPISDHIRDILHFVILNLDERGYLLISEEEIAQFLAVNIDDVQEAKNILHQLEPSGVGATNLNECLLIQAKKQYKDDEILFSIISDYLQQLADKKWELIAKELHIELEEVKEAFGKIKTLVPKPTINFSNVHVNYVMPDIYIQFDEKSNSFQVMLNNDYLPEFRCNHSYVSQLKESKEWQDFTNHYVNRYNWLRKSIEQRKETILKIMTVIIEHQQEFFHNGFRSLRPLTLKEVADEIGMHESTVSRATANKIVQTPIGTFELRHLFSNRLMKSDGNDTSQTKVKQLLKELIENEDKTKPLSDQKLANYLKQEKNIVISRRTVAKYRDEMYIPSSSKRKEVKI